VLVQLKDELQRRIERKEGEIREFEIQLREAQAYLSALLDMAKLVPRESGERPNPEQVLRPGSAVAKAREAIKQASKPLHIIEILRLVGMEPDKKNRISLGGSLSGYARRGEIFTRPAPNTFGLLEFKATQEESVDEEPPPGFGGVTEEATVSDDDVPF
jgi:hypothetical protein